MEFSRSLKQNHLFRRLYRKGNSSANRYLVLYCRRNGLIRDGRKENRLGLTVPAKLGHAVVRNRIRRRLREIYRLHESSFRGGYDLVVVARSASVSATYTQLETALLTLSGKLGLLAGPLPKP